MTKRSAVFAVLIGVLAGCSSIPVLPKSLAPEIGAVRPQITGIDFQGVDLSFAVDLKNNLPVSIRTPSFRYGLDIESAELMNGTHPTGLDLPAGGIGTAVLPVRLTFLELYKLHQNLKGKKEIGYALTGALLIPAMGRTFELPLSHSGTFPVLEIPKISNIRIADSKLSLGNIRLAVEADIENPNIFALGLSQLGYAVRFGNIDVAGLTASTDGAVPASGSAPLRLSGDISASNALVGLLFGGKIGTPTVQPVGAITTPYGSVDLPK